MYQKIIIVGNLGGDPEMKYLPDGKAVTNFSLATKNWNGDTTWFRVSLFGKSAETANQHLNKGARILVEGRLNPDPNTGGPRIWQRQDGTAAASYEITADGFTFVGSKGENAERDDSPAPAKNSAQRANSAPIEEDDIPF
jgi:single-strand DNA-binding protein